MVTFEMNWKKYQSQIKTFCYRLTKDNEEANDLLQEVAIKAYLGYKNFGEQSSFISWTFKITQNTFYTSYRKNLKNTEMLKEFNQHSLEVDVLSDNGYNLLEEQEITITKSNINKTQKPESKEEYLISEKIWGSDLSIQNQYLFREMFKSIWVNTKKPFINNQDYEIIRLKLENPKSTTKELAALIGISPSNFDVKYSRLCSNLRSYCFLNRPEIFGGMRRIEQKLSEAQKKIPPLLNDIEFELFNSYIIKKKYNITPNGWREILREACNKMFKIK
jgi:RNA polymerase sigma factor (sigma-70 family)